MTNSTVNKNENTLQSQIDSIESKLSALRLQVSDLESQQSKIELNPDDYEDQFDDMLDDSIPEIEIGCLTSSPRPWGCFQIRISMSYRVKVFPTPVGVFLKPPA